MKKTIFTVLGITVFAITLNAQNLMKNPSFETFDWEAPDATATNWHYDIGKTGAQILKDESGAYSGATGLELISTGVERAVITQDFIAVKGNTNYVLTIIGSSLRNDANGNMAAFLTGDQWSSEGAWLANLPFIQFPLSDYQEYAQVVNSFTTHADAVRIKVHIGYTEAGQKGTTYFDDVYLAEGTVQIGRAHV